MGCVTEKQTMNEKDLILPQTVRVKRIQRFAAGVASLTLLSVLVPTGYALNVHTEWSETNHLSNDLPTPAGVDPDGYTEIRAVSGVGERVITRTWVNVPGTNVGQGTRKLLTNDTSWELMSVGTALFGSQTGVCVTKPADLCAWRNNANNNTVRIEIQQPLAENGNTRAGSAKRFTLPSSVYIQTVATR
jgi:hypothetical protein